MYTNVITKTCFKCSIEKPITEFYAHPRMADGHLNKCKECAKKDVTKNYDENREAKSDYEKRRNQNASRKAKKAECSRKHTANNPEKKRARTAVGNALRDGKLTKKPCVYCDSKQTQAHHSDYLKPLDVTWVCFKCHREREHGQVVVQSDYVGGQRLAN